MPRRVTLAGSLQGLRVEIPRLTPLPVPQAISLEGGTRERLNRAQDGVAVSAAPDVRGGAFCTRVASLRVSNTAVTAVAAQASWTQVYGPIPNPFRIREVLFDTAEAALDGLIFDLLVAGDSDRSDTRTPTGSSVFRSVADAGSAVAPDGLPGVYLRLQNQTYRFQVDFDVPARSQFLKFYQFDTTGADNIGAATCIVVYDEFESLGWPGLGARAAHGG